MNLLLAFAPFIAFAVVDRTVGATPGLIAGALIAAALIVRDALSRSRSIKILEVGTVILFGGLTCYSLVMVVAWSIVGVRLCVDAGLLVTVLLSLAVRQPFTIQYARERVAPELWQTPGFLRINDVITGVWAGAFALMVGADLVMLYVPSVPIRVGVWITILAILGRIDSPSGIPKGKEISHDCGNY